MPGQIKVNFESVYAETSSSLKRTYAMLEDMNVGHRQLLVKIDGMDGSTNTALAELMLQNRDKVNVTAETLCELFLFIEYAAQKVEQHERKLKKKFNLGGKREKR